MKKYLFLFILFIGASKTLANENNYTISFSPLSAVFSYLELSAEFKASENIGVSIIYGSGSTKFSSTLGYGIQTNYYRSSSFDSGFHYGVELFKVDTIDKRENKTSFDFSALLLGPYVGYKALYESGITLVSQIGYQKHILVFDRKYDAILLNFNIGYTF